MTPNTLIDVHDISKTFQVKRGGLFNRSVEKTVAVNNVSLSLTKGEVLGCVGGSGSGKSTLGRMIMRLIEPDSGSIMYDGTNLRALTKDEMRQYRRKLQIVFQDPLQSLNPRRTVSENIAMPLLNFGVRPDQASRRVDELLELVGLDPRQAYRYPHEYSGGQCQRIAIARALALEPEFLFLDEPVSALDVSIQAQILNLLANLRKEFDLTFLFVSHDLKIVQQFCDRTVVMYRGNMVETGDSDAIYHSPKHPFTRDFLGTVLHVHRDRAWERAAERAEDLEGTRQCQSDGCIYAGNCSERFTPCDVNTPRLTDIGEARRVACHLYD